MQSVSSGLVLIEMERAMGGEREGEGEGGGGWGASVSERACK